MIKIFDMDKIEKIKDWVKKKKKKEEKEAKLREQRKAEYEWLKEEFGE